MTSLKVDKRELVNKTWEALSSMEALNSEYLEAFSRFTEADNEYRIAKSQATLSAEGKTASIRAAKATLMAARQMVERAKAKITLQRLDLQKDTARLYYRVLSSVLAASGGEALLYPINDKIPDPVKEIEKAYNALVEADEALAEAAESYIIKDVDYELKKAQKIAQGLPGKNEEERKAHLYSDPEIQKAKAELDEAKIQMEMASQNRQMARDSLRFWLSYMRSLGLDEAGVDDPGMAVRR